MRKITLIVGAVGLVLVGHVLSRTAERFPNWGTSSAQASTPASADFLLVKDHEGWPANMEKKPLSEIGNWRVECDGSLFDYRDVSLGDAVDRAHELECEAWEVSAIDGLSWN